MLNSYGAQYTSRSQYVQEIQKQLDACQQAFEWEVKFEPTKWKAPRVLSFTLKSKSLNESVDFDVLPAYDALGKNVQILPPEKFLEGVEGKAGGLGNGL